MSQDSPHRLLVEGWRSIPHSYATVNQFQLLEMMTRKNLSLAFRELPYYQPSWRPAAGLLPPEMEKRLADLPAPQQNETFDACYRIWFPFALQPHRAAKRTVVFATSEWAVVPDYSMERNIPIAQAHRDSSAIIVTPSNWSRKGFLNSGADPQRVHIVPHGVDPAIFHPLDPDKKSELRKKLGWDGFIFLHVGAMTPNKGVQLLLKVFAHVIQKHPHIHLVLKGMDALYQSNSNLARASQGLTPAESSRTQGRVHYDGRTMSLTEVAAFYQAADAYVTPYVAEGFNLPALEAIACGLPVICTSGGPTDDFTRDDFAWRIEAQDNSMTSPQGFKMQMRKPSFDHLMTLMSRVVEDQAFRDRAREAGPAFVNAGFTWRHVFDRLLEILF